jgi:hypothetical protein
MCVEMRLLDSILPYQNNPRERMDDRFGWVCWLACFGVSGRRAEEGERL